MNRIVVAICVFSVVLGLTFGLTSIVWNALHIEYKHHWLKEDEERELSRKRR